MRRNGSRPVGRMLASIGAIGALVLAALGLLALSRARFGDGRPWHGVDAPWTWRSSDVGDAMGDRLGDDTVIDAIVRIALTVAWVALLVVVITTIVELAHMRRHRGLAAPPIRGLGWAQVVGRFIAAGLIVTTPVVTPLAAMAKSHGTALRFDHATAPPAPTIVSADSDRVAPPGPPTFPGTTPSSDAPEAVETDAGTAVHVVARGESVYSIAAALTDDDPARTEDLAMAIVDLNLGREQPDGQRFTNPAFIMPGWRLLLPEDRPASTSSPDQASPAPGLPDEDVTTHVVAPGDTLSEVADAHLGDPSAWPEIWEENAGATMVDGRTFDDPHLILPGWELRVPGSGGVEEVEEVEEVEQVDDVEQVEQVDDVEEVADVPAPEAATTDRADPSDVEQRPRAVEVVSSPAPRPPMTVRVTPPAATVPATTSSPTTTTVTAGPTGDEGSGDSERTDQPAAPNPVRLEQAAMLAAGILAVVAVRRRARLRGAKPRSRVPDPHPDIGATERRLRLVDPGERALRTDVAIRAAAAHIVDDAQIGIVEVSPDGAVSLRLTGESTLPPPWQGEGADWVLPSSVPIELLGESARRVGAPCVALAQLGLTDDGNDVLVDLEACGLLAVDAPADQADQVITALAAGLASSIHAEVANLIGVDCPCDAFLGHRNAHRAADVDAALELAASLVGSTLSSDRSSFEMRARRTGGEVWEPAVVLLVSGDGADAATIPPMPPGQGCAVVAATHHDGLPAAPTRLLGRPSGWELDAFGRRIALAPVGLDADELAAVATLVADADEPLLDGAHDGPDDAPADEPSPAAEQFVPREHEIVVHLLDRVAIRSRDGDAARFERSKTVELIAWLATHRGRMTRSAARTALWDLDVRDATFANVVSEARRGLARLSPPPDDAEWLARTLTEELPLHELVITDADLIEERLAAARLQPPAQAVATLRPAVELVVELPFAGTSYLWPDADGITSNTLLLATSAATELAAHALAVGDTELVFWATGRGLQVLPGHEELIGLRMRAHAHTGDLAAVRQEWESYERVIIADAWSDGEPAPKLVELRHELLSAGT